MIEKTIKIGNIDLKLKSSGSLLRRYRDNTGRDFLSDIQKISGNENVDSRIIENIIYTMNKYADPSQPDDIYEWLDQFDGVLDVLTASEEIIDMIMTETKTQSESKKK